MAQTLDAIPRSSIFWRAICVFAPLVMIAAVLIYLFVRAEHAASRSVMLSVASKTTDLAVQRIHVAYNTVHDDVRLLASLPSLQKWLTEGSDLSLREVEQRFLVFSRYRPTYAQIRYIDAAGHERVRIDRDVAGKIERIAAPNLQDKSKRYYVDGTLALKHGEVYVSEFDLNTENGVMEQPANPVLRFGTPVVDSDRRKRGMVIINYRGQTLLDQLRAIGARHLQATSTADVRPAHNMQIWLANAQGYWLIGPSAEDEWGFMITHRAYRSMPRVFPDAWATIRADAKRGQIVSHGNLFTFSWVSLGQEKAPSGATPLETAPSLAVMTFVPKAVFSSQWNNRLKRLQSFMLALLLLMLSVAWFVARQKTAREAAERDIRISETRFRTLLESAPDAVVVSDFAGEIVLVNARAEELFDYERGELIGQSIDCLVPERFRAAHVKHRASYVAAPMTREMAASSDLVGRRRDGSDVPVGISLSPVDIEGETFVFSDIRDKTEKREAERQIKALNERLSRDNAALDAVNKELEAFSYSVSHDLRTPLRAIDGYSQALLEDFGDTLPDEGKGYLERVRRATQRMGSLIDDLLALAHVARSDLYIETLDLSAMATDVVTALRERYPSSRSVVVDIVPGIAMQGDARLMRLVLENLLDNAWKFTSKQDTPHIVFGHTIQNDADVYFVKDNGVGFDMAYADKLFGAFQRLHDHGLFPGSGIGLATVQRIITKHGGKIWAEAEPEKGATFFLAF